MKRIFNILTLVAALLVVQATAFSQVQPTFTTLGSAVGSERTSRITVVSATGFVASTGQLDFDIFIDHELMRVTAISGTLVSVQRGQASTTVTSHKSGATVFYGYAGDALSPGNGTPGPFTQTAYFGACTASAYPVMPVIQVNIRAAIQQGMYNCLGGQWYYQTLPDDTPKFGLTAGCNIDGQGAAYSNAVWGANTSDTANQRQLTSFYLPATGIFTGFQVLQGNTATTDNISMYVADSAGNPLVAGAAAGVLLAGTNTFLKLPFALSGTTGAAQTKTILTGPALYFVGVIGNGATAGAYYLITSNPKILTAATGSITFGTYPSFVPPTTFTTAQAPVVCPYY